MFPAPVHAGTVFREERRMTMKNRVIAVLSILLLLTACLVTGVFGEPEDTSPAPEETSAAETVSATDPAEESTAPAEDHAEEPAEDPAEEPAEEPSEAPAEEPADAPADEPSEETAAPTGTLTISRPEGGKGQAYCYSVTDSEGRVTRVVIRENETSVKLVGMTVGETYTVKEIRSWSWRQPDGGSQEITISAEQPDVVAVFEAKRGSVEDDWLSGTSEWTKGG